LFLNLYIIRKRFNRQIFYDKGLLPQNSQFKPWTNLRNHLPVAYNEVLNQWATRDGLTVQQLQQIRNPLLSHLPIGMQWYKVTISKKDLKKLQVINELLGWSILSGFKGSVSLVAKNLEVFSQNPPSLPNIPYDTTRTLPQAFRDLLNDLNRFRVNAGSPQHNLTLTLIASSRNGPFTILDGNHTAVGLYFRYYKDHPEVGFQPFTSYLGVSANMPSCQWYHTNMY
jgi:hypothetical protein